MKRLVQIGVPVSILAMVLFTLATIAATGRTQERTLCLRATQVVELCPRPGVFDKAMRGILTDKRI